MYIEPYLFAPDEAPCISIHFTTDKVIEKTFHCLLHDISETQHLLYLFVVCFYKKIIESGEKVNKDNWRKIFNTTSLKLYSDKRNR